MRVYVHDAEGKRVVEADEAATLVDVTGASAGTKIWAEDAAEPLAADATVRVLAGRNVAAVHVGKGLITVSVTYAGATKTETFGPGAKIDKVLDWATGKDGFDLPEGDRHDLVLRLKGSTGSLDPDTHVGTLAGKGETLALDLLPGDKFAG
ncbi:hypothetical protein [Aeromicrobium sp. HA]|uniref:hypothetical protein n=1 Tax=Aeromicrobium sp. HA TaxID=3009077 RepID=UPI0022AE6379|nr:hypothetical protein [Aeromicrobium sp. HA]